MPKTGRPSKYSEAIALEIYERLSLAEPLYKICEDEHIPSWNTICRWQNENADFRDKVARARENSADYLSHQVIDIADEVVGEKRSMVAVQAARLRIDARVKMMQMLKPKTYGDKQTVEMNVSGELALAERISKARKRNDG